MTGVTSGHLTSNIATMMHLLKGNIGSGILAMPSAFANAGLWVGFFGIPLMGFIATHCMHILAKCQQKLCDRFSCSFLDYEEVAEQAMRAGPSCLHRYARLTKTVVSVFLMITQLGFCCVYAVFVATNVQEFFRNMGYPNTFSVLVYMVLEWPLMIALNQVKNLKQLAYASTIANALQATGMVIIFANLLQDMPPTSSRPAITADISRLPVYFGTAIYAFEGISLILPLRKEMKEPSAFGGKVGVLNTGMIVVTSLYMGMGFFGFLKYGFAVEGSITLNLPSTWANELCRLMFALSIFLSYALQMYVPLNLIWPWVMDKFQLDEEHKSTRVYDALFRAAMVTATFLVAAIVPKLDLFIALVGALSSSCLALIFPPLIDILTEWDAKDSFEGRRRNLWYMKNIGICLFGIIGFMTGTYASIADIIKYFKGTEVA